MKITGTFDIECAEWDRFAVAATYQPTQEGKGDGKSTVHRSVQSFVDFLLSHPKSTWWGHASGSYDTLCIAEELRRRSIPCSIDLAGSRISRLRGGGITVRDSWPLVPLPMSVAARIAGEHAPQMGLPCRCSQSCGGYCSIRPADTRRVVADKCTADARVLYRLLDTLRSEVAPALGLVLRGTLGGTAWATARERLALPNCDLPPAAWRRIRESYYGGRVVIARPHASGPGTHWDINSAYPASLAKTALPCGAWSAYAKADARRCFDRQRPGVYACEVTVPEIYLPPLPARVGGRLAYPIGTFRGVWTLHELRTAQHRGTTIDKIAWCHAWEAEEILFDGIINEWFRARSDAGKYSPLGQWLRLLPNSITGKLAEGPERQSAKMFPESVKWCEGKHPCNRRVCVGACGSYVQLDIWGQVWGVPFYRPSPSAHIQWAAYLTAATRERWLIGAESQGMDLVYGDTDSLWTTGRTAPQPTGARLGEWEYKGSWRDFECTAPRQYRYTDDKSTTPVVKSTGATLTNADWLRGTATVDRGVLSFTEAAATGKGLFQRKELRYSIATRGKETGWYGDRVLDPEERITLPMPYATISKGAKA